MNTFVKIVFNSSSLKFAHWDKKKRGEYFPEHNIFIIFTNQTSLRMREYDDEEVVSSEVSTSRTSYFWWKCLFGELIWTVYLSVCIRSTPHPFIIVYMFCIQSRITLCSIYLIYWNENKIFYALDPLLMHSIVTLGE